MEVVLITRLKRAFDTRLAEAFHREGYRVFAVGSHEIPGVTLLPEDLGEARALVEKSAGKIDLYVDTSDERSAADCFTVRDGMNERLMRSLYEANVLWPMAALEAFLPLLDAGEGVAATVGATVGAAVAGVATGVEAGVGVAAAVTCNCAQAGVALLA